MSYIANTDQQRAEMLAVCGARGIEELFRDIPADKRPQSFDFPEGKSELEVVAQLTKMAASNYTHLVNFVGAGFYDHFIPAAVDAIASRSEFYTAYTPYQPELSQGTLQAIYEYQTDMCRLTGLDVSNASVYDGGTALYEACQMAIAQTGRRRIVLDGGVNPIYRTMLKSYTKNLDIEFVEIAVSHGQSDRNALAKAMNDDTAAVILQNPNFFGAIDDHTDIAAQCHEHGILAIQSVYPLALSMIKSPGECGIDIATGEGQSLGIPLSFGGPYLGFMCTKKEFTRRKPGRIVGRTRDTMGREGFVLTLQAREQHIRREKAISNICSNEALCALRAHVHLSLLGKEGLRDTAELCVQKANYAKSRLEMIPGVEVMKSSPTFNEFTIRLNKDAGDVVGALIEHGFAGGFPLGRYYDGMENYLLIAVTEKRSKREIDQFVAALEEVLCS